MKNLVFTEQSLFLFATNFNSDEFGMEKFEKVKDVLSIEKEECIFFFTAGNKDKNTETVPFIIFDKKIDYSIFSDNDLQSLFFLVHRVASQLFQHNTTRFTIPRCAYSNGSNICLNFLDDYHLFLRYNCNNSSNIYISELTNNKTKKIENDDLDCSISDKCNQERLSLKQNLQEKIDNQELKDIDSLYRFNQTYSDEDKYNYDYNRWVSVLSPRQSSFLNNTKRNSLKLVGPAGTGKTLVMELKAIKLVKEALEKGEKIRILFTCHSWNVAFQVDDFIGLVAPETQAYIEVCPLLELAKSKYNLHASTKFIGEDSFEGKYEQIIILDEIIFDFVKGDWKAYRSKCSEEFVSKFESIDLASNNFTWEIMTEIACVIGANGFMPIDKDLEQYLNLDRRNWMLYLANKTEREVVFQVYIRYMAYLAKNRLISSDQVINDYTNYLATYNWYYEREESGYDYIFVDEMQLFNDQERSALTYLSRKANEYPLIIMAMDPKQAVDEVYTDLGIDQILNDSNPDTDASMGKTLSFTLDIAYRYTKEIFNFLRHVDKSYPQLDVGHDWNNGMEGLKYNKLKNGLLPQIYCFDNEDQEVSQALKLAESILSNGKTTIILCLRDTLYQKLQKYTKDFTKHKIIKSKDDLALFKYEKKKIFISEPKYVIGLQFDNVILIGCYNDYPEHAPHQDYKKRVFLSDLYLGASRAKERLILLYNKSYQSFPSFLKTAIEKNIIHEIEN